MLDRMTVSAVARELLVPDAPQRPSRPGWRRKQRSAPRQSHDDNDHRLPAVPGSPLVWRNWPSSGRTLWRCRADVLAYFDHHSSNGRTEAINGRLEALRAMHSDSATSPTTESAHSFATSLNKSMHSETGRAPLPTSCVRNAMR
jgi:Transposase